MGTIQDVPVPRYDFYQTPSHITVALYIKGYAGTDVRVDYHTRSVEVVLPEREDVPAGKFTLGPLAGHIAPGESSERVLGTKIELKLAKHEPINWPSVVATSAAAPVTLSAAPVASSSSSAAEAAPVTAARPPKKNWDKLAADMDEDVETDSGDANAGGDAALQKLFAGIYRGADEDTKRAMIKSFTESGGTSLSTDWSSVGGDKVAVRPPEGMYEMKM